MISVERYSRQTDRHGWDQKVFIMYVKVQKMCKTGIMWTLIGLRKVFYGILTFQSTESRPHELEQDKPLFEDQI
jgi:hypothetical protein